MFRDSINCICIAIFLAALCCDSVALCAKKEDTALWLARSCVGEAGWDAHHTGECAAILHIYKKRAQILNWSIHRVVHKYSAAIKRLKDRKNRWVLDLNRAGTRPKDFPKNITWAKYKQNWLKSVALADAFLNGHIEDPLPQADHYGSRVDSWRAKGAGWKRVHASFRNQFWRIPTKNKPAR